MTLKSYLALMLATTIVCWGIFLYVVNTINPDATNWIGFFLFYISLFLSITGTAAIIGFLVRFILFRQVLVFRSVSEAFRQSFLAAALVIISLFLLSKQLATKTNLMLLILALASFEYFLVRSERVKILKSNK